jgi:glycerophosphoryl diester phosphodiesterase
VIAWLLVLGLVAVVAVAGGPVAGMERRPLVAAHRGGALLWPENSLLAFREALALGVDLVECDVHLTADGEIVVIHDPTLDRTTTGRGAVGDLTLAQLGPARLKGPDGRPTDEPVPTLRQLLDLLVPGRAGLLLEIKVAASGRRYAGIEEKVFAALQETGMADRTVVMAFEPATVQRLRELAPSARIVFLVGRRTLEVMQATAADVIPRLRDLGVSSIGMDHRLVDGGVVDAARAAGVALGAWTVNTEADLRRLRDLGIDILISDRPDLALQVRGGDGR